MSPTALIDYQDVGVQHRKGKGIYGPHSKEDSTKLPILLSSGGLVVSNTLSIGTWRINYNQNGTMGCSWVVTQRIVVG